MEEINIFKETLPTTDYFDLSKVIKKLELLNPFKSLDIINQWVKSLEDIQVNLGNIETQLLCKEQVAFTEELLDSLSLKPDDVEHNRPYLYKAKFGESRLSFQITCIESSKDFIHRLLSCFNDYYSLVIEPPCSKCGREVDSCPRCNYQYCFSCFTYCYDCQSNEL